MPRPARALATRCIATLGAAMLAACDHPDDASRARTPTQAVPVSPAVVDDGGAAALELLERHALSAFVVPLLDDDRPPRFTEVAIDAQCAPGTEVRIDGRRFATGERLPGHRYRVAWTMVACRPFGSPWPLLDGTVEVVVTPGPGRLDAVVVPQALVVTTATGRVALTRPFAARPMLDRVGPRP